MPPDAQTLAQRLNGRGTEDAAVIHTRMQRAVEESAEVEKYDYMIINDDLEKSMEEVHRLIESQHSRIDRNHEFIEQIRQEVRELAREL